MGESERRAGGERSGRLLFDSAADEYPHSDGGEGFMLNERALVNKARV